ncbi:hypothetical protein D9756_005082 [Leucocoprinus leucothites]|uniref:BTB domain-containing protein n=1 Tax=Leucocoprinus leucothites TaxID=201217 RepID=A0A8H5G8R2_9AGAR|nr:hypothetical protein D9756_005082 [Leucoagaricus leucothites]
MMMEVDNDTTIPVSDASAVNANIPYIRDKDYYFEDESVILLAGTRLFKIHRTLFAKGSPLFQTMFSLPQDAATQEGQSDERPILFHDSPQDFRALCWALYSSPPEILAQQYPDTVDISKMISIAALSLKYDFRTLMNWALDTLELLAKRPGSFIAKVKLWSRVGRIYTLAKQCSRDLLLRRIEEDWLYRISVGEPHAFRNALIVAESFPEHRAFHGKAYYSHLKALKTFSSKAPETDIRFIHEVTSVKNDHLQGLNDQQKTRIQRGFWSLSLIKIQLLRTPRLVDNPACVTHARGCVPTWREWWEDLHNEAECKEKPLEDPGEIIEAAAKKAIQPLKSIQSPCDAFIRAQVQKMVEDFSGSLADYFMIP